MGNRGSLDRSDEEFSDEDARTLIHPERTKKTKQNRDSNSDVYSHSSYHSQIVYQNHSTFFRTTENKRNFSKSLNEGSTKQSDNLRFYQNEIRTRPEPGFLIEDILKWYGNHEVIEKYAPTVLQWLFPTKNQSSKNLDSQPLQDHEVQAIRGDDRLLSRAQSAFSLMLEFYGMQPIITKTCELTVKRSPKWEERYQDFNSEPGNVMRITRILSCMGEMGFSQYQCIWLRFLLEEIVVKNTIHIYDEYTVQCWIGTLASDDEKIQMADFYAKLKESTQSHIQNNRMLDDVTTDKETGAEPMHVDDEESDTVHNFDNINLNKELEEECIFVADCKDSSHWLSNMPNVLFYLNRTKCLPEPGFYLEELKSENRDVHLMYKMHKYIQWLFPTPEQSEQNSEAVPLTEMEAAVFSNSKILKERFLEVYQLLLACYGLDVVRETGEIHKTETWTEMSHELNKLTPLARIITRILTSLGVTGFSQFQMPLLYFFLTEAFVNGSLPNLAREKVNYWIDVIVNHEERQIILEVWRYLKREQEKEIPSEWNVPELKVEDSRAAKQATHSTVLQKRYGNSLKKELVSKSVESSINGIVEPKNMNVDSSLDLSDSEGCLNTCSQPSNERLKQTEWELHEFSKNIPKRDKPQVVNRRFSVESDKDGKTKSTCLSNKASDINIRSGTTDSALCQGNTTRALITNQKENRRGWLKRFQDLVCGVGRSKSFSEDLYPYKPKLNANIEFYLNKKKSSVFWGHTFEEMLQWKGDYHKLEMNHQYIQWLFPIPEGSGVNFDAQALQPHEAEVFQKDPILQRRVLRAYQMMLDFYGMELFGEDSGQVQRTVNWIERYQHLNRSWHNHLRITRIVKSLGYLGLQKYQSPWVNFILHEIFEEQVLQRLGGRQCLFWIEAIADEIERHQTYEHYIVLKEIT